MHTYTYIYITLYWLIACVPKQIDQFKHQFCMKACESFSFPVYMFQNVYTCILGC